jgi:UDP-N-acetylglucosamine 2-epimerase (non-hydrolysing)
VKVLFVFGTRPEAIKLAPVVRHLGSMPERFTVRVCVTAQHRDMLDQALSVFGISPHHDLDLMQEGQTLSQVTARALNALEPVIRDEKPDMVMVQGDTTSTLAGALAAFYQKTPVGHVEAGLRTGDAAQPFPEEMNRLIAGRLSTLHFAPTAGAAENLRAEGVPRERIFVTGNTGIDALLHVRASIESGRLSGFEPPPAAAGRRLIAVTAHRRESFNGGIENICRALARLAARPDVHIVLPVHRNPNVGEVVRRALGGAPNVTLLEPLAYVPFVGLMSRAYLLITDSGGVQEEGPSFGKPVLVTREKTERPEAVEAGASMLVGTSEERIYRAAAALLDDGRAYARMAGAGNPYGDGRASERIAEALLSYNPAFAAALSAKSDPSRM